MFGMDAAGAGRDQAAAFSGRRIKSTAVWE